MKTSSFLRQIAFSGLVVGALASTSCMTTYDAYGRPVQSVDPGAAVAGAAAAGVVGYALANDNDHYHHRGYYRGGRYYGRPYYGGRYYGGSYGGYHRRY
jgi:hypothetical protein